MRFGGLLQILASCRLGSPLTAGGQAPGTKRSKRDRSRAGSSGPWAELLTPPPTPPPAALLQCLYLKMFYG